jgi:hypothetical protein
VGKPSAAVGKPPAAEEKAPSAQEETPVETLERVWDFEHIMHNVITKKAQSEMQEELRHWVDDCCNCPSQGARCSERCENGGGQVECRSEGYCGNQRIHRNQVVSVDVRASKNGAGCFTLEEVGMGDLVLEYRGEFRRDQQDLKGDNRHTVALPTGYLDATRKGSRGRFINHSCAPNVAFEIWMVRGLYRVGIFALRPIPVGEELTADYRLISLDGRAQPCNCGERVCRESMLGPPQGTAKEKKAPPLKETPPPAQARGAESRRRQPRGSAGN